VDPRGARGKKWRNNGIASVAYTILDFSSNTLVGHFSPNSSAQLSSQQTIRLQSRFFSIGLIKELKIHLPRVSRSLAELESKKLVERLTPSEKVGRIYRLSEKGRRVLGMVRGLKT
jgi:hypothetical protein